MNASRIRTGMLLTAIALLLAFNVYQDKKIGGQDTTLTSQNSEWVVAAQPGTAFLVQVLNQEYEPVPCAIISIYQGSMNALDNITWNPEMLVDTFHANEVGMVRGSLLDGVYGMEMSCPSDGSSEGLSDVSDYYATLEVSEDEVYINLSSDSRILISQHDWATRGLLLSLMVYTEPKWQS